MKLKILFFSLFLISSFGIYSQEEIDIDLLIENAEKTITQDSIKEVKKEKIKKAWDNRSIIPPGIPGSLNLGFSSLVGNNYRSYDLTNKFEIGYFDYNASYFGFQFGIRSSDLVYQDEYGDLTDSIWNFVYGRALSSSGGFFDAFYLNITVGYHAYNYDTTESFGAFYDIGGDFYAAIGLKLLALDLGGLGVIPEINYDINGNMNTGVGIAFSL